VGFGVAYFRDLRFGLALWVSCGCGLRLGVAGIGGCFYCHGVRFGVVGIGGRKDRRCAPQPFLSPIADTASVACVVGREGTACAKPIGEADASDMELQKSGPQSG
jgi:hypothetical protein